MKYTNYYSSPLGKLLMAADDIGLTGLWFENQLHYAYNLDPEHQEYFRTDSLWSDNDLRRHRSSNRQPKRYCTYVSTSCRASRWA